MSIFFVYILIISIIVLILGGLPILLQSFSYTDSEKISAYECGFEPFGDAREVFDVHFYLVGILFIIFDIEIVFLAPWILSFDGSDFMFVSFVVLSLIFIVGFLFEYRLKVLDWNKLKL